MRSSTRPDGLWAVVLAGGIGSRFWPVSTRERPKKLLPLASERPLIVDTVERATGITDLERIRILAGDHLAAPFKTVLPEVPPTSYCPRRVGPVRSSPGPLGRSTNKIPTAS